MNDPEFCRIKEEDTEEQIDLIEENKEVEELIEAGDNHHIKTEEASSALFDSEVEQGPSTTLPLLTSTPERHDGPQDLTIIRGGSHHIPQRTRPENRKRKAANLASREFLQCMRDITQQQMEEERELRGEEMKKEMMMRREELDYDAQLRREEMSQRQKESESFASVFSNLTAALLQRK
ncbi:unnamed protein product [Leuciscus chuanchicus]